MFKPSDILISAYVERLSADYRAQFERGESGHCEALASVARMALSRMTFTNAMYTNLHMTLLTTQVATDILRGRAVSKDDVSSTEWLHFLVASLCYLMGFVRGTVLGDNGRVCVVNERGATIELKREQSDGALYPHAVDRAKMFAKQFFRQHALIDGERIAAYIEYTRYPALTDRNLETGNWGGLLRGAQTIAVVSDPRFSQRLKYFFWQLKEAGMASSLGFSSPAELFQSMPVSFWKLLYPQIVDAIGYLKYTGDGLTWLALMNAHMLEEEHRSIASSANGRTVT